MDDDAAIIETGVSRLFRGVSSPRPLFSVKGWRGVRQGESRTRALLRVRDTMDQRYAEPLDLDELAALVHLSPSHFLREFRRAFGETPHQYLYRRRIERAAMLLRATDRPVTDIAREVGYASLGTFTRTFTRLMGHPPLEHRALGPPPPVPGCWLLAATRPVASPGPEPGDPDPDP